MDTIKIDDKEYKFSDLSEDARAQLLSLQATDAKISELQRDMAIAQTARMAYARALNELLPQPETSHWSSHLGEKDDDLGSSRFLNVLK